jgi:hypothetical protein
MHKVVYASEEAQLKELHDCGVTLLKAEIEKLPQGEKRDRLQAHLDRMTAQQA